MTDSAPRRRLGRIAAGLVVLALVVVAAQTADRATVTDVLSIPDFPTVRPERLENGTPVFVVHAAGDRPGDPAVIDVIQAFTTEVTGPVTGLVGWCAASRQFVAAHHGALYDRRGRRMPATLRGRSASPAEGVNALADLIHRQSQPVDGRTEPEDPILVGGVERLRPWQVQDRPGLAPTVPPARCRLQDDPVVGTDAGDSFHRLVDHSFLAGPLDPAVDGWQMTEGWLLITPDGRGTWCEAAPLPGPPATCSQPRADVRIGFAVDPQDVGGVAVVIGGPLAARLQGGVVQRVAVTIRSTWIGSSLQGTERYQGAFATLDADRGMVVVRSAEGTPVRSEAGTCRAAFPSVWTPEGVALGIQVSGGTTFQVDGTTDPADLAALPTYIDDGPPVEVVVDAVTCRALAVTDDS
ncbi:hypothetical protein BH23ACT9_BH23ACT9_07700 [soil metagenome]